jgi:hypothetical protein
MPAFIKTHLINIKFTYPKITAKVLVLKAKQRSTSEQVFFNFGMNFNFSLPNSKKNLKKSFRRCWNKQACLKADILYKTYLK